MATIEHGHQFPQRFHALTRTGAAVCINHLVVSWGKENRNALGSESTCFFSHRNKLVTTQREFVLDVTRDLKLASQDLGGLTHV